MFSLWDALEAIFDSLCVVREIITEKWKFGYKILALIIVIFISSMTVYFIWKRYLILGF